MELGSIHTHTHAPNRAYKQKLRARVSPIVPESEKVLEARLRTECTRRGWTALKLLSQLHRGLPDRLVLAEDGIAFFAEIKTTGKKPTRLQKHCHNQLRKLGFDVWVIDNTESLDRFLSWLDDDRMYDDMAYTR